MLLEPMMPEEEDKLLTEISYTREKLSTDLQHIKEWLIKQQHLPPSRLRERDSFFKMFLTGCKGNLERAKKKLDAYYTIRSQSKLFESRDPLAPDYVAIKDVYHFSILPKLDKEKLIQPMVLSLYDADYSKFDFINGSRKLFSFAELRLRRHNINVKDLVIVDCSGTTMKHILKVKPLLLRDLARIAQDVLPFRFVQVYFINAPKYVEIAVNNLVKPLLNAKLKKRISVSSSGYEVLHEYIDNVYLPKEYEGENSSLKEVNDEWHKVELQERNWYLNELAELNDESKRITNDNAAGTSFLGITGSLKKLFIDWH